MGDVKDIIILGGGPAGLAAGIYAARARMDVVLMESLSVMGQATMTDMIENYPGVERTTGFGLIETFKKQAVSFGLETRTGTAKRIFCGDPVSSRHAYVWNVEDENGVTKALSLIVASGARAKKIQVPGEDEFLGRGVSYCATCDAAFFREKNIVVVGGGDTAVEEALFLTKFGKKVTIVHRRDRLRATKLLQERAEANDKIEFAWSSSVERIDGSKKVEKVIVRDIKTGGKNEIPCDGVFIFVGWRPNTDFVSDVLKLSDAASIIVDSAMATSARGVFAAGDCCERPLHQVVTACGDGAIAAVSAQHYVEELKGVAYK
jgi:thioredoxin reductase (NADPH)